MDTATYHTMVDNTLSAIDDCNKPGELRLDNQGTINTSLYSIVYSGATVDILDKHDQGVDPVTNGEHHTGRSGDIVT